MDGVRSDGNHELLINGLSDDVSFLWVLIDLGLLSNPPGHNGNPSPADVDAAFATLSRLQTAGLIEVGRIEYVDGGPPGRFAPVKHVPEELPVCRERALHGLNTGDWSDWAHSCWVVNTDKGDEIARAVLAEEARLGRGLVAFLGTPGRLSSITPEERVVAELGDAASDVIPRVHAILAEIQRDKSQLWAARTVAEIGVSVHEWVATHHPEIDEPAANALASSLAFEWK
jgi:hypothetical protein